MRSILSQKQCIHVTWNLSIASWILIMNKYHWRQTSKNNVANKKKTIPITAAQKKIRIYIEKGRINVKKTRSPKQRI